MDQLAVTQLTLQDGRHRLRLEVEANRSFQQFSLQLAVTDPKGS